MSITLIEESDGNFSIERDEDGVEVGYLETTGATIVQIDVYPEYRRNGYATEAVEQFIDYARENTEYYHVRTTAIVSSGFEDLVEGLEFTRTENENANTYQFEL